MKEIIDESKCPYRKGSNAYKHWHEGFHSFARDILTDVQKHYEDGRNDEHDVLMKYFSDYNKNKRKLTKLRDIEIAEFIQERNLREAAAKK